MQKIKLTGILLSALALTSCFHDENIAAPALVLSSAEAIVATVAADFSSGAHSVISNDISDDRSIINELVPTGSDITIAAFGKHFYRIERAFAGNNITKFSADNPQTPIWQYSTNGAGGAVSSNPYDMIFVNETKAYVLRYGTGKAWIVNPSAATEADFKIGELDLSAYDIDGVPEMATGIIVDGKLYILLQRLAGFSVPVEGYVAIFDVATDQEIDANLPGDTLKGIKLQIRNPGTIGYDAVSDSLFVQGSGSFFPEEFTGGIEKIELATYTGTVIIDDGALYGLITEMAFISDSILYFVGYAGFSDNTLYKVDLSTSPVTIITTTVTSLISGQISSLSADKNSQLWVSDSANATVRIIDAATDSEIDSLSTSLNPDKVVFIE